ncbi:MAG: type VI secretion system tip protein VgrG [Deltaproteobacteria bacterium]|nr:type VI secretion system tip protein VgrG [Deltaproteobacteria bacterium]
MNLTAEKFKFQSSALNPETFSVVKFNGDEGLSKLYQFDITLVSEDMDIDLDKVMEKPAAFSILRSDKNATVHGVLKHFDVLYAVHQHVFYRAVLVPALWWLTLTEHNQIFLDKSIKEIIPEILKDGGLSENDFELRLQNSYSPREYVCQYRESHYNFLSRWLEHEGMYYFFEHEEAGSKLIITDTKLAHQEASSPNLRYLPPTGMESAYKDDVLSSFTCRRTVVPSSIQIKDYNYRKPDTEILGQAELDHKNPGKVYLYGEHVATSPESKALAKIRAEEFQAREKTFYGTGTTSFLKPGYHFTLEHHFRSDFNQKYLVTGAKHIGSQAAYLTAGLKSALNESETQLHYNMEFTAIGATIQYRPERTTEKSRFYGVMNAKIDASGSADFAELDEHGRYKVILPFDISGRSGGKASKFMRMMQPYAGVDHGMHFPLHKDTEVLLTFIDGDPDRPVISGAVPNTTKPSVVKDKNQTQAIIQTGGQNTLLFEDKKDSEHIILKTPVEGTYMRVGAKHEEEEGHEEGGCVIYSKGKYLSEIGSEYEVKVIGNKLEVTAGATEDVKGGAVTEITVGAYSEIIAGQFIDVILGLTTEIKAGRTVEIGESARIGLSQEELLVGSEKVEIKAGGPSVGVKSAIAQAITLVSSITAGFASAKILKDGSKIPQLATAAGIAAINGIATAALTAYLLTTKNPTAFGSTLEMDKSETKIKSPSIELNAKKDISLDCKTFTCKTSGKSTMQAEKAIVIKSAEENIVVKAEKKLSLYGKECAEVASADSVNLIGKKSVSITGPKIELNGDTSVTITTDKFTWKPKTAGKLKTGPLEIDGTTGQVKIG